LSPTVRGVDIAFRYSGDEFFIIMPRCDSKNIKILINQLIDDFDAGKNQGVVFLTGVVLTGSDNVIATKNLI
jgi:GGDEF domain-containing protein